MLNIQYYSPIIESRHQRKVTLWLTLKSDHLQDIFQKKKSSEKFFKNSQENIFFFVFAVGLQIYEKIHYHRTFPVSSFEFFRKNIP